MNEQGARDVKERVLLLVSMGAVLASALLCGCGPKLKVSVASFDMDEREVSVADYQACIDKGACTSTLTDPGCNWPSALQSPVNCVSQEQAATYCAFVGKRLPTEPEWVLAAVGTDGRKFPWGNSADVDGVCLRGSTSGASRGGSRWWGEPTPSRLSTGPRLRRGSLYFGQVPDSDAPTYRPSAPGTAQQEAAPDDGPRVIYYDEVPEAPVGDGRFGTCEIGSATRDVGPYGVRDMAGNVAEWTSTMLSEKESGVASDRPITMGYVGTSGLPREGVRVTFIAPNGAGADTGFRCAKDVE